VETLGLARTVIFLGFTPTQGAFWKPSMCTCSRRFARPTAFALLEASGRGFSDHRVGCRRKPGNSEGWGDRADRAPADAKALTAALITLLKSPERRVEMGRGAMLE